MPQKINPVLLIGGGIAAYLLLKPSTAAAASTATTAAAAQTPAAPVFTAQVPVTNATTNQVVQQVAAAAPTEIYGVNSGIKGGNGSFYTCANYNQLLSLNPNLGNPNYKLTNSEADQYLSNYLDLQQGLPNRIGNTSKQGFKISTIELAAQDHWTNSGCGEKRIFYPLIPMSNGNYVIPPPSKSIWGTVAEIGTIAAAGVLTVVSAGTATPFIAAGASAALAAESKINGPNDILSDEDVQMFVTGAYILKKILPFYLEVCPDVVNSINNRLDDLLTEISS